MAMPGETPELRSARAVLELILPLGLSHPSVPELLALKPLARPSTLSHSTVTKFCNRLNAAVLGRDGEGSAKVACGLARGVILDDEEGWVLSEYGKGWVNTCLTDLATQSTSLPVARLGLLETLILQSPQYPSFEREAIHPIMGKVSVTLTKLLGASLSADHVDETSMVTLLNALYSVINHSPSPFRPSTPSLRTLLQQLIVPLSNGGDAVKQFVSHSPEVREVAADVLASLHLTNGKAQIPSSWSSEIKSAIGGIGMAMNGIVSEGFVEEAYRVVPPAPPSGYALPSDAAERLPVALQHLEGWVEAVMALLRYPTSRPVPVPIAQVVAAGLRCLNLTLDTPTLPYISPQHRASLVASLPRIWTAGLRLLAGIANSVGDHLFPHLSLILDHTVWLAETSPKSMHGTHLQLLRFHSLFLDLYSPAVVPVEYPTRLLRLSLRYLTPLLDPKASSDAMPVAHGSSKRGKKRARGAEDGLVGGLEGRERAPLSSPEVEIILAALSLAPTLHPTPLLAPALLTLSIRLHMSLYLSLPSKSSMLRPPSQVGRIRAASTSVLEKAAMMNEGQGGTSRGWKAVILSILTPSSSGSTSLSGGSFSLLLHPSLPPLHRQLPPLSQLHFFATETDEEKKIRLELGIGRDGDVDLEAETGAMEVDDPDSNAGLESTVRHRPEIVPVSRVDSDSELSSTILAPAPHSSELRVPTTGGQDVHRAILTEPIALTPPIIIETSAAEAPNSSDPLAPSAATAPLTASSNDLYPDPVGPSRSALAEASAPTPTAPSTTGKFEATTATSTGLGNGGDDDDDEPLPEMDSDMDLSEDEEEDDEEGGDLTA